MNTARSSFCEGCGCSLEAERHGSPERQQQEMMMQDPYEMPQADELYMPPPLTTPHASAFDMTITPPRNSFAELLINAVVALWGTLCSAFGLSGLVMSFTENSLAIVGAAALGLIVSVAACILLLIRQYHRHARISMSKRLGAVLTVALLGFVALLLGVGWLPEAVGGGDQFTYRILGIVFLLYGILNEIIATY
ncbi:hypothetical protein [Thermosporothrix hazakensis]|uniref:hypothetical protein n=1 Tax=Thermosporothrix hazakensis TaxID=644383 RepID=UPI001B876657|nr:hypothetical protein [Thermosporothrix hazakensis]